MKPQSTNVKPANGEKATAGTPASTRKTVDWDGVSVHYRAGARSLKDIGSEFDVSDAAIIKHARKEGWTRDLKGKVKAKADAKVSAAMVSAEVSAQTKITEQITVEVEATVQARVRLAHRTDIARARKLAMQLLEELEHQTGSNELYEQLFELLNDNPDPDATQAEQERHRKRREVFERALSLSGRTKTMKEMADTLKTLVGLERQSLGLDEPLPPEGAAIADAINGLSVKLDFDAVRKKVGTE